MKLAPDEVFERYRVEAEVGCGGMATVYRVRHTQLGSTHALKVLDVQHPAVRRRLLAEGRIQASLRHANIVSVTDVIEVNGQPGLVMDYVDGPALDHWLAEHRPSLDEALGIFRGVLAGVARAHQKGVVHRDLKPANVLLETADDVLVPRVTDFGLVKFLETDSPELRATRSGLAMGTPAYMAPEQVEDSKTVDQRADVWALGCLLYELVTGKSPFDGPTLLAIFARLSTGDYPPPESMVPDLPPAVGHAIRAALVHDRELRVADCTKLKAILDGRGAEPARKAGLRPPPAPAPGPATAPNWDGGPVAVVSPSAPPAAVPLLPTPSPTPRPEIANSRTTFDPDPVPPLADNRPLLVVGGLLGLIVVGAIGVIVVGAVMWGASSREDLPLADDDRVAALVEAPPGTEGGEPAAGSASPAASGVGAGRTSEAAPSTAPTPAPVPAAATSTPPAASGSSARSAPATPAAATTAAATTAAAPASATPATTTPPTLATPPPEPVVVTVERVAPPPPSEGKVIISGSHNSARLYGEAGVFSSGAMPPGTYRLRVKFGDDPPFDAGEVRVKSGKTTNIRCDAEMALCKVEVAR